VHLLVKKLRYLSKCTVLQQQKLYLHSPEVKHAIIFRLGVSFSLQLYEACPVRHLKPWHYATYIIFSIPLNFSSQWNMPHLQWSSHTAHLVHKISIFKCLNLSAHHHSFNIDLSWLNISEMFYSLTHQSMLLFVW
jgi:hypothetical protein